MEIEDPTGYQQAAKALLQAKYPVFVAHRRPDGDSLGANIALHLFCKKAGKLTALACIDAPSERFSFLTDAHLFQRNFKYEMHDLIVVCDAGDKKMSGFHEIIPQFLSNEVPILNIDHHVSNDLYGRFNLVEATAASATVIVYKLLKSMNADIDRDMALALLAGIYNDTGAFMHSNTTLEVFQIAADLAKTGADVSVIAKYMFRQKSVNQLKLWGLILDRMRKNKNNVISSVLTVQDIHGIGASSDDTGGIIDLMNTVAGTDFAMIVAEDEKGFVKGSFRTQRDDVDVARIAGQFGGGGHKKAAGFRIPGRLRQEVVWKIERSDEPVANSNDVHLPIAKT